MSGAILGEANLSDTKSERQRSSNYQDEGKAANTTGITSSHTWALEYRKRIKRLLVRLNGFTKSHRDVRTSERERERFGNIWRLNASRRRGQLWYGALEPLQKVRPSVYATSAYFTSAA